MFIELAEFLRCPRDPGEAHCVVVSQETVGRTVIRGTIGCPTTKREYPITDGIADFTAGETAGLPRRPGELPTDAATAHALLGVNTPGGYVVLLGSAARLAPGLAELLGGVHFVGLNVPDGVEPSPVLSLLRGPHPLPLRTSMGRGVIVGAEFAREPWLTDAARIVLKGLRVVVLSQKPVPHVNAVASGQGVWVGEKR